MGEVTDERALVDKAAFDLGNGRQIYAIVEDDGSEKVLVVYLEGQRAGRLLVAPGASNSVGLRAEGRGVKAKEPTDA